MFDFLNFFLNGASVFTAGASVFNTYAHLKANKEKENQALWQQRHHMMLEQEQQKFNQAQVAEKTAEYSAISS